MKRKVYASLLVSGAGLHGRHAAHIDLVFLELNTTTDSARIGNDDERRRNDD